MPLERAVAAVCYRASFSVAELLYAIAAGVFCGGDRGQPVRR